MKHTSYSRNVIRKEVHLDVRYIFPSCGDIGACTTTVGRGGGSPIDFACDWRSMGARVCSSAIVVRGGSLQIVMFTLQVKSQLTNCRIPKD